jgi:hypothetical protein
MLEHSHISRLGNFSSNFGSGATSRPHVLNETANVPSPTLRVLSTASPSGGKMARFSDHDKVSMPCLSPRQAAVLPIQNRWKARAQTGLASSGRRNYALTNGDKGKILLPELAIHLNSASQDRRAATAAEGSFDTPFRLSLRMKFCPFI